MNRSRNAAVATLTLSLLCLLSLPAMVAPTPAKQAAPLRPAPPELHGLVTARDSVNGHRIADRDLIERIERFAAQVPAEMLAGHRPDRGVRYLAHAFASGDDAAISYGLFHEPAAALAFGCALDADLAGRCAVAAVDRVQAPYEDAPGVRCEPMGIALGAPAYEPDRCEPIDPAGSVNPAR